jgi:hypothetical protein
VSRAGRGVDVHGAHQRKVDDHAVVADRTACHLVSAASDAHDRAVLTSYPYRLNDVGDICAACDYGRSAVDEPVPDSTRCVVGGMVPIDRFASQRGPQRIAHRPLSAGFHP